MYDNNCLYHIIHSLVPPSTEENRYIKDSFLRLENICARTIVYKTYDGTSIVSPKKESHESTLPNLPPHLHNIILKAYLLDKFYTTQYSSATLDECTFDELPQILYNWPYEEFKLKELMPRLTPRLDLFSPEKEDEMRCIVQENVEHFDSFRFALINKIIEFYLNFHKNSSPKQDKVLKMKRIDITGYKSYLGDIIRMYDMMESIYINDIHKLEIVVDTEVSTDDTSCLPFSLFYVFDSDFIKVNHVSVNIHSFEDAGKVKKSIRRIVRNGTISINVKYAYDNTLDSSGLLEHIYDRATWGSNVLSLQLVGCASSMNFLQPLSNLVHLDLRFNNLHGRLNFLTSMSLGLLYLNLCYCKLTNSDIYNIAESCHVSTLKQLNLSGNDLTYDDDCINLIDLCKKLPNVLKLDIYRCKLGTWPDNSMSLLFDSIKNMPNVAWLSLSDNGFSTNNIQQHIMKLRENISLRYLELPSQVTRSDKRVLSDCINKEMNMSRPDLLWVVLV